MPETMAEHVLRLLADRETHKPHVLQALRDGAEALALLRNDSLGEDEWTARVNALIGRVDTWHEA